MFKKMIESSSQNYVKDFFFILICLSFVFGLKVKNGNRFDSWKQNILVNAF